MAAPTEVGRTDDELDRELRADGVELYDTTLRDGTQREGISPTVDDKLVIARAIDELGVDWIEGGWPGANPKDTEFFARCAAGELELTRAGLVAFGMTRRPDAAAAGDAQLDALLEAATGTVCLVAKSSPLHVTEVVGTTLDENLAMVADSVALLRAEGRRVLVDAEHFFDGHLLDAAYAEQVLAAAAEAGAETVVLCDTNGGMLPHRVETVVAGVRDRLDRDVRLGVHAHDDTDCAEANSLAALRAGARHVQGTVGGIGERCGNADIVSIIANLQLKLDVQVVSDEQLARLTRVTNEIAETMNLTPDAHHPYVGRAAFAHKAGLHASGLARRADAYQHVEPERVGNSLRMLMSELAGRSTVRMKGEELGIDLPDDGEALDRVVARVKELEHQGWSFEAADASFELLVRRETGDPVAPFGLESFRAIVERPADGEAASEATVRVQLDGERLLGAGEGNGPVDALDHAFRQAVNGRLPQLERIELVDFKVRILDGGAGTAATTRVLVTSTDGERTWETIGVSPNIIEASWLALADAYAYGLDRLARGRAR